MVKGLMLVKAQSKRLPYKNVVDFAGEPMFLMNLRKCLEIFPETYVSTENDVIARKARELGAKVINRPKELLESPNIGVYKHAVQFMDCDAFVAVQANSPTVSPEKIKQAKDYLENGKEVITTHPDGSIYGSVWGMTIERLENYGDPYNPLPEYTFEDPSVDIHTDKDLQKALLQL